MKKALLLFFIGSLFLQSGINAQDNAAPSFNFKNGLGIASPDSAFTMNIRFRIQNRAAFTVAQEDEDTWDVSAVDARVRRMRLRFEGQVYDPRLTYLIQLSFSRGDMDWDNSGVPNVLRDAMVFYKVSNKLNIALGQ
ncbi:MAG TPA: porin, partial [Bacteroidia bacterium]|nr:porin [Bacteroidia bacterium]